MMGRGGIEIVRGVGRGGIEVVRKGGKGGEREGGKKK